MRSWDDYKKTMNHEYTIWEAAKTGDLEVVRFWLNKGSDIEATDARGYSPLMLAVYNEQIEMTKMLLESGANPNSTDPAGNSVLMGAAFKGYVDLAELLIESGANVAHQNAGGLDAKAFASNFGRQKVVDLLDRFDGPLPRLPKVKRNPERNQ